MRKAIGNLGRAVDRVAGTEAHAPPLAPARISDRKLLELSSRLERPGSADRAFDPLSPRLEIVG